MYMYVRRALFCFSLFFTLVNNVPSTHKLLIIRTYDRMREMKADR